MGDLTDDLIGDIMARLPVLLPLLNESKRG